MIEHIRWNLILLENIVFIHIKYIWFIVSADSWTGRAMLLSIGSSTNPLKLA